MKASEGALQILDERIRQVREEGWTEEHDDKHPASELLDAGICYALKAHAQLTIPRMENEMAEANEVIEGMWPWEEKWWKPADNPMRNLEKAGALIAAEIDRLHRMERRNED